MSLPALGPGMVPEKRRGRAFELPGARRVIFSAYSPNNGHRAGLPSGGREADRSGNPAPRVTPRTGPASGQGQESRPVQAEAGTADGRRPAEAERDGISTALR